TRAFVCVLDGVGAGELPDAADYGDAGAHTLLHTLERTRVSLPNLGALGLGEAIGYPLGPARPDATFGRLLERSPGKDTTTGHWEMMGLVLEHPFPTYPDGFPPEVVEPFETVIGRRVLGNKPASGTIIIEELGADHLATGRPILYTSADSVFQLACHEDVVPVEQLYDWCLTARAQLTGRHGVGRVIARPFVGRPGLFERTYNRRDFSLAPPGPTYLDLLTERGVPVVGVGKIGDIFTMRGVGASHHIESNGDGLRQSLRLLRELDGGFLYTNLVDFDMVWGHRNDVEGFAAGLIAVDGFVPEFVAALGTDDLLVFCADHGVDPTTEGYDHTREYSPLAALGLTGGRWDGLLEDVGATVFHRLTGELPPLCGSPIT
ncbi:MAG TPA: phosphopentomutase, partial [Thermoleophilia bacterium]|nr:phosphopentomutase [Thermoleophilia bacterium]